MFNMNYKYCGCQKNGDIISEEDFDYSCSTENGCESNYVDEDTYVTEYPCGFEEPYSQFPTNATLAESYIPVQRFEKVFRSCLGLKNGTIFPELVDVYEPGESMDRIKYLKSTKNYKGGSNK